MSDEITSKNPVDAFIEASGTPAEYLNNAFLDEMRAYCDELVPVDGAENKVLEALKRQYTVRETDIDGLYALWTGSGEEMVHVGYHRLKETD